VNKAFRTKPVFLGLTHIGQIYALSWCKKIGMCSVFDFDKKNLENFKKKKFTDEEPNIKKIKFDFNKINIISNEKNIAKAETIFFTYDTPININNGIANINYVEKKLVKLLKIDFNKKVRIIITSQVYPGFTDYIKNKYLGNNNKIELIYMVDTLKMGSAINRFLNPEQLIFGCDIKNQKFIIQFFKKFKCKKYIYSFKEAELIKISINLYLYFAVNFSNILDDFSKQIGANFTNIIGSLQNDIRIGKHAYIHPSPSISGGHLERDVFYIKKYTKNKQAKKIFQNLKKFNDKKKIYLKDLLLNLKKKNKIKLLIVGISYKQDSFSMVNSMFKEIFDDKKFDITFYDSFFKKNKIRLMRVKQLDDSIEKSDIVLFNYGNNNDIKIIKRKFSKEKNKYLVNISSKQKMFLNNKKNIINFFSNQISPIC
jgi:nucleotide sugar dehydrogenase